MSGDNLISLAQQNFKLGKRTITLSAFLGVPAIERTRKKFPNASDSEIQIALVEMIRFLFLTANSNSSLFFPGNQLIDDIWHSFITETAEYKALCLKIKPGYFLEHSGMKFETYSETRSTEELNQEQLSWLVSYIDNFGAITPEAYSQLMLAQELSSRLNFDREKLNQFAGYLRTEALAMKKEYNKNFNFDDFLNSELSTSGAQIAEDPSALEMAMRTLLDGLETKRGNLPLLITNEQLEAIYSKSTALGFTLWQHMAAVERLLDYEEWQNKNSDLWNKFSSSEYLVGLGTTHLAHAGGSILNGEKTADGFLITGNIPWATGTGIFDYLMLAFETNDARVFCIIPFPEDSGSTDSSVSLKLHKLACINGTSTSKINFTNFLIKPDQILFSLDKNAPRPQRQSRYHFPELGMAVAALKASEAIVLSSTNSRHLKAKATIENLNDRLLSLREKIKAKSSDTLELSFEKDELIRDSVRFLLLTSGGSAMSSSSLASRLQLETMLLDVLIQDPRLIEKKLTETSYV